VADLNALAELGKVYQDSLALSAQLRNLSSFRLQQDKVLGRGSLAVVQEGGCGLYACLVCICTYACLHSCRTVRQGPRELGSSARRGGTVQQDICGRR
jgi:hypothetical protein